VIFDDGLWVVDHSTSPVLLAGFLIVKPRRHVDHVGDLSDEEAAALGPLLRDTARAAQRSLGAAKVYVCSFGEAVGHVHFYVVPRYEGMPPEGPEVLRLMFEERRWATDDASAVEAARLVREELMAIRGFRNPG
jgi:diadenosine tetraphosphate (Ap4A) HIT family hydrolase